MSTAPTVVVEVPISALFDAGGRGAGAAAQFAALAGGLALTSADVLVT
jgi:hypothetical protein